MITPTWFRSGVPFHKHGVRGAGRARRRLAHMHEVSKQQVERGMAGMITVGNSLDPCPQYKDTLTQVNMTFSEVNITPDGHYKLMNGTDSSERYGPGSTEGWQKRVNGQMNPILRLRPSETPVWNMGQFGARGASNFVIADDNLQNPWTATILSRDGASAFVHPYSVTLGADELRMNDISALTVPSPGNRMSMAVTAPTTPGTYYLMDGAAKRLGPMWAVKAPATCWPPSSSKEMPLPRTRRCSPPNRQIRSGRRRRAFSGPSLWSSCPRWRTAGSTSTTSPSTARSSAKASCPSLRSARSRNGPSSTPARSIIRSRSTRVCSSSRRSTASRSSPTRNSQMPMPPTTSRRWT